MPRFKRPSREECEAAIGLCRREVEGASNQVGGYDVLYMDAYSKRGAPALTAELTRALQPDEVLFKSIPKQKAGDWLVDHEEPGQTFQQFQCSFNRRRPTAVKTTIYLLPLTFFENAVPDDVVSLLAEFASHFFAMPVKILGKKKFGASVPHRRNPYTKCVQVHAGKILEEMKTTVPIDAFCVGAITMCDIYPREEWNFVFGLASLVEGVGVYSLARYMAGFPEETNSSEMTRQEKAVLLKRSCLLMCHEMAHMFGLKHCIFYHCLMNGSNHFEENDKKPLHLCPVCLRKLHYVCGFDIMGRYSNMLRFCQDNGLTEQADWFRQRMTK